MNPTLIHQAGNVPIYWDGNRIFFEAGMTIDGDASPRCYGPNNSGLDYTANAGHPGNWWAVVTGNGKPDGNPIVQTQSQPYPGMWVSTTSYERPHHERWDTRRYLDSERILFGVLPSAIRSKVPPVVLGCRLKVTRILADGTSREAFGLCGDFGPNDHAGEGSIALATELGINPNVRTGGTEQKMLWEFWPGVESSPQGGENFPLIPA